jgi:esterase/lipase
MTQSANHLEEYAITATYDWCVKAFRATRKLLKLNIKLHDDAHQGCHQTIEQGDIFLFNHFARFETFIPQYLIHEETGLYCRSIASSEFFKDERFATFLRSIGVIPNDLDNLFPFMAREILHGRKLIIFPEGGMVKDKRVVDERGKFGVYSRSALERRKHHRGAAVIALALDAFKTALLRDYSIGQYDNIERWAEQLGFDDAQSLMQKAIKPTCIVPSHITFYPLRVNDNILYQAARLVNKGINKRFAEELIIEGNLLFKHTDMDIRFSKPLIMGKYWRWWEKYLLPNVVHRFETLEELFNLTPKSGHWGGRIHAIGMKAKSHKVRDDYMKSMYQAVTVNLSHIASYIVLYAYQKKYCEIPCDRFHKILYVSLKRVQKLDIHLHRSLKNPNEYADLLDGNSHRLAQFLETVGNMDLLKADDGNYRFQDKLIEEFHFDEIRTENLINVYANELAPLSEVTKLIRKTFDSIDRVDNRDIARMRFDDEDLELLWDLQQYSKPRHQAINLQQTFTEEGNSFRLLSDQPKAPAVLLVHGFMASPAEMRSLGARLQQQGCHVFGIRLKGHATSPWDLRNRDWHEWAASVQRGYRIAAAYSDEVHLVGFSTGGLLVLNHAVSHPEHRLTSVVSACAPVKFQDKNMKFVPLMHRANKIVRWVSEEGLMPFRPNNTEHPNINYAHIPIRALYQLQKFIAHFFDRPARIDCPVHLLQGDEDPVVVPSSVDKLYDHIEAPHKDIISIRSQRHGIVYEDIDNTQEKIIARILDPTASSSPLMTHQEPETA